MQKNTPVSPRRTRVSEKVAAGGQTYGTGAPHPIPSHAAYVREQMTSEAGPGRAGEGGIKEQGGRRRGEGGEAEREEAAVAREVNKQATA